MAAVMERHPAVAVAEHRPAVAAHHPAHPVVDAGCASHPAAAYPNVHRCPGTTMYSDIPVAADNSNRLDTVGRLSRTRWGPPGHEVSLKSTMG
jgi:hypothetical protein